jgi:hypothetical protein
MKEQIQKTAKEAASVEEARKKIASKLHTLPIKSKPQGPQAKC